MDLNLYVNRTSNVFAENRLLKFAVVGLFCVQVVNAVATVRAMNTEKVFLVPPQVNQKMWISGNKASDEYLKEFARYVAGLAFSYSQATARNQFSELLTLYRPAEYEGARKTFYEFADRIDETKATGVFFITRMFHDEKRRWIEIEGIKKTFVAEKQVEEARRTFVLSYAMEGGKLQIVGISDKETAAAGARKDERK